MKGGGETDVRNGDGADDGLGVQIPQAQGVRTPDAEGGLEDGHGLDKVRGENQLPLPVDAQTVRRELLSQNVQQAGRVLRPLVDDVEVGIRLDQTAGRGADSRAHIGDVETTAGLGTDLIGDRGEDGPVALQEGRPVRVGRVEVEGSVLRLEKRQETTSDQGLAIERGSEMVRVIAAAGDISHPQESTKGVLR